MAAIKWPTLAEELDRWSGAGKVARFWLRDDDASEPSAALDALLERLRRRHAPCLLAVVPMLAGSALADRLRGEAMVRIAMHGAWHANHLPVGRKPEETPIERGMDAILAELATARERMMAAFGEEAGVWYVPPWNRISPEIAARLPELGFRALSTFADQRFEGISTLAQMNTHIDIMDWKGGRIGRPAPAVMESVAMELARARQNGWRPVGVLTHHLVHDRQAWTSLDAILDLVWAHPAAAWRWPDDLLPHASAS